MIIAVGSNFSSDVKDATRLARIQKHLEDTAHVAVPLEPLVHMVPDDKKVYSLFKVLVRCDALITFRDAGPLMNSIEDEAIRLGLNVYIWEEDHAALKLPLKTEATSPLQVKLFMETIMSMYRTHLRKNADYSPANILATGQVGVVTRLWDKTARLMNLTGIKFKHLLHEGVEPPEAPQNEAIDDTYMDLAVYAIIGKLLREDAWGK